MPLSGMFERLQPGLIKPDRFQHLPAGNRIFSGAEKFKDRFDRMIEKTVGFTDLEFMTRFQASARLE